MTSTDKLALFIIAIGLGVVGLTLMASMLGAMDSVVSYLEHLLRAAKYETLAVSIVVTIAGLYLLSLALRQPNERSVSRETPLGNVRISLRTVESLVLRAASQVKGVRDVQPLVHPSSGGLAVALTATVVPDIAIPDVAEELQSRIGEYIQSSVGMTVTSVRVHFRGLSTDGKARVE